MELSDDAGALMGQVVLITGAGNGVGRAAALMAASRGATVLCVDRDEVSMAETAELIAAAGRGVAHYRIAEITSEDKISRAIDELVALAKGRLDAVLHVAGIMRGQRVPLSDLTLDTWTEVIVTNLTGAFLVSKYAVARMDPERMGVVVLVASRSGITVPSGSLAYGASKGGIHGYAMSLEKQLSNTSIRVHTVCPGDVDTPLMRKSLEDALENGADPAEIAKIRESLGTAEEIASVLVHLIDPAAWGFSGTVMAG
jgi:NAD(P)-dependent dehydrogenase (short-subunit alcohol dehydrogenase family)